MKVLIDGVIDEARADAAAIDDRWTALADGTLDEETRALLLREAEQSEEARQKYALLEPIGAARRAEMIARALGPKPAEAPNAAPPVARVPRRAAWMVRNGPKLFAAVAGVVATVAVFRAVTTDDAGALPTYTLTMSGGTSKVRSATVSAAPVPMFAPGTRFEVILRPEEPARGEVVFAARYEVGATSTPWTPPAELSAAGTVRISGMSEDVLPRTRGELTLVFFIGRSKEVAAASQRTSSGGGADTHEPGLSIFRRRVIIASGPE